MKRIAAAVMFMAAAVAAHGQASGLSGTVRVWPQLTHVKYNGAAMVSESIGQIIEQAVTFGTNANQMNKWASRTASLTNGEAATFSLLGGISNAFGDALTFGRVNWISISAPAANGNDLTVGGASADPFTGWIGGAAPTATVRPGGIVAAFSPDATGYAVATNNHQLKILNAGTNTVTFNLYIGGK